MRIVSSSVYNQLMMFMLKEGDTLFRRLLALDSKANPRPEDVAKGARWVWLREQGGQEEQRAGGRASRQACGWAGGRLGRLTDGGVGGWTYCRAGRLRRGGGVLL